MGTARFKLWMIVCGVLFAAGPLSAQAPAEESAGHVAASGQDGQGWRAINQGERFFVETGFTLHRLVDDRYVQVLREPFGFEDDVLYGDVAGYAEQLKPMVRIGGVIDDHLAWHIGYRMLDSRTLTDRAADQLRFHNHGFDLGGRLRLPFVHESFGVSLLAGIGPTFGFTDYLGDRAVHLGYLVHLTLHAEVNFRWVGVFLEGGYVHAPAIRNAIGYVHNAGGVFVTFGLRFREREEGYP